VLRDEFEGGARLSTVGLLRCNDGRASGAVLGFGLVHAGIPVQLGAVSAGNPGRMLADT